jgi:hypothetical protein
MSLTSADSDGVRNLISVLLLCFVVAAAVYLWFVNLFSGQRVFGILLSAVLLAFSMLIYSYRTPRYKEMSKRLLMLGYLALAILLFLGIAVSLGYPA